MNHHYTVVLDAPDKHGRYVFYSYVRVIAASEAEARKLVEQHLEAKMALGFSEREMRRLNPKRTPWVAGIRISFVMDGGVAGKDSKIGVVCD